LRLQPARYGLQIVIAIATHTSSHSQAAMARRPNSAQPVHAHLQGRGQRGAAA
jgi:hypothetical protein